MIVAPSASARPAMLSPSLIFGFLIYSRLLLCVALMTSSCLSSSSSISVQILNDMDLAVAATISCKISSKYRSLVIVLLTSDSVDNCDARRSILRYCPRVLHRAGDLRGDGLQQTHLGLRVHVRLDRADIDDADHFAAVDKRHAEHALVFFFLQFRART